MEGRLEGRLGEPVVARPVLSSAGTSERSEALKRRVERFAVAIVRVCKTIPKGPDTNRLIDQLLGAGTAVAAHYRAACRAGTRAAFIAKLDQALEEADEAQFWLATLARAGTLLAIEVEPLLKEADEFIAILVASLKTARRNR